jgi:hypothetical protein
MKFSDFLAALTLPLVTFTTVAPAPAFQVFNDRAAWNKAVGEQNLQRSVTETFSTPVRQNNILDWPESGIVSINSEDVVYFNDNSIKNGMYYNAVSDWQRGTSEIFILQLPKYIQGFAVDIYDGVGADGKFDVDELTMASTFGTTFRTVDFNKPSGFLGIVLDKGEYTDYLSFFSNATEGWNSVRFDNLTFVPTSKDKPTEIFEPSLVAGLFSFALLVSLTFRKPQDN